MNVFVIRNKTTGKFVSKGYSRHEKVKLGVNNTFFTVSALKNSLKCIRDLSARNYEILTLTILNIRTHTKSEEIINACIRK